MAKNFLDQALSLIGLRSPNATDYYDPSVYKTELINNENSSQVSGVEKYQQKKNASSPDAGELSGVAKYLAEKQQSLEEIITTEDEAAEKLSGVAKYLAAKQQENQAALANMTSVERYLFNLKANNKITPSKKTAPDKNNVPEKLSRVDKYLAKKQEPAVEQPVVKFSKSKPINKPTVIAQQGVKEEASKTKEIKKTQAKKTTATLSSNKIINLTEGATQCQAATLKHAQCSRKTSLETIRRTINKQKYKFTVCSQHNSDSFTPFKKFLQQD